MKQFMLIVGAFILSLTTNAQELGNIAYAEGNHVYGNKNYSYNFLPTTGQRKVYLSDSTLLIEARVLMNSFAEDYVAMFGVSQEGKTVKECNEKINARINAFVQSLQQLGIPKESIYIDWVTQNRVYDYAIDGTKAEQYSPGFELKKNVIIHYTEKQLVDQMTVLASEQEIFDLIKVDYIVKDFEAVYDRLFDEASKIIKNRKDKYVGLTNVKLMPTSKVYAENFESKYPSELYKSYQAFEASNVTYRGNYNNSHWQKDKRKANTFYYNKVGYGKFDKVIEPVFTEPAVQFVYVLQVVYEIEGAKKKTKPVDAAKKKQDK